MFQAVKGLGASGNQAVDGRAWAGRLCVAAVLLATAFAPQAVVAQTGQADTVQTDAAKSDAAQSDASTAEPSPSIKHPQPTHIFIDDAKDSPTNHRYVETDGTITLAPSKFVDFSKGTWSFQAYGSMTISNDSDSLYLGHVGAGYFLADGLSINLEIVGGVVDGSNENQATGGDFEASGFDLLFRWHALRGDGWSIYVEGGAGAIYTTKSFPSDGTHFNFSPQAGVGFTFRVLGDAQLMAGVRYHHISNAGMYSHGRNPGFDGIMPYAGIMIPF